MRRVWSCHSSGRLRLFRHWQCFCWQSLDSSCDMVCLKERIQKSQEEREKREERLLQTHTLQQTGNLLCRWHAETHKNKLLKRFHSLLMVICSVTFGSHGVKLEQLPLVSHANWRTVSASLPSPFAFIMSRYGRRRGDNLLRRPHAVYHGPWLLLSGVRS